MRKTAKILFIGSRTRNDLFRLRGKNVKLLAHITKFPAVAFNHPPGKDCAEESDGQRAQAHGRSPSPPVHGVIRMSIIIITRIVVSIELLLLLVVVVVVVAVLVY